MSKIPPIEIDLSIKRRINNGRLKTKGYNQRYQFVNPLGDEFQMPQNCKKSHTIRSKASKYRCSTINKRDVLEFRRNLFASSEKRDQLEYLDKFINILTPKNHVGNAEIARIMTVDYTLPNTNGDKICVCRTLFMAASGMNQRRLQNINKKLYKSQLLSKGLIDDLPSDLDETEKGKRLKDMITNKKEKLLSVRKGELETFKNIIRTKHVSSNEEEENSYNNVIEEEKIEISVQQSSGPNEFSYDEDFYEQVHLDLNSMEICRVCCKNHESLTSLFATVDSFDLSASDLLKFLFSCHVDPNGSDNLPQNICDPCLSNLVVGCQLKTDWMESQKLMRSCMAVVKQQEFDYFSDLEIFDQYERKLETESGNQHSNDEIVDMEWLKNPETEEIVYDQYFEKEKAEGDNLEGSEETHQKDGCRKRLASKIIPAKCYFCDKDFETTAEDHFQTHHNYVERKQCDKCTFETEFPWFLNLHYQLHAEEDFKLCNVCGRHISRLSIYRHRKYCGVKKEPSTVKYPCAYCGQSYYSSYFRNVHQRIHTNEKPYSCDKCQKSFHRRILLRQHMLQHGVEPDFKCYCGKGFVLKYRFVCHQTTCSVTRKHNNDNCN